MLRTPILRTVKCVIGLSTLCQEKNLLELKGTLVVFSDENKISKMLIQYCFERPLLIKDPKDSFSRKSFHVFILII